MIMTERVGVTGLTSVLWRLDVDLGFLICN
jgi:hypothetical protein